MKVAVAVIGVLMFSGLPYLTLAEDHLELSHVFVEDGYVTEKRSIDICIIQI